MNTDIQSAAMLGDINSLVGFFAGVEPSDREDVITLLLYAQSFASGTYDFDTRWHMWMGYFRNRLEAHGFKQTSIASGGSVIISGVEDLDSATFKILHSSGRDELARFMRKTLEVSGIHSFVNRYFTTGHASGGVKSFQAIPCQKQDFAEVQATLCSFNLSVDNYSAGTKRLILHFKAGTYRYDRKVYALHKKSVTDFLINKANARFRSVEI